ncbi:hypothetical protein RN001_016130 [Aquatica leii]|uniref:Uncharacterized protein n=1 Tax=Aquatica leii TaxID=1421715 RepID=A0AAN7NYZ8_9COLE|nr:hypothetical protein RN001_016130 [Aquatica leii]
MRKLPKQRLSKKIIPRKNQLQKRPTKTPLKNLLLRIITLKKKTFAEENLVEKKATVENTAEEISAAKKHNSIKMANMYTVKQSSKTKRLILLPLNELFSLFKQTYCNLKIGRSMFCALRPKWCVLPGSSGTHSVCVCKYHQNVKLVIEGAKLNVSYRDLMEYLVCDVENDSCMLDKCSECPGSEGLLEALTNEIDDLPEELTSITRLLPKDEFLNHLVEEMEKLKSHNFISKIQSNYFKEFKGNLKDSECLVIGDFAENFTFCKNFINLCQHDNDFGLIAEWNFFATSHGKNFCAGIGGTTRREVTRTSMQRPYNEQILTPKDMFKYCAEKITGITYIFVSAQEIKQTEAELMKRFELCLPVKGTRWYHRFVPVNDNEIRCFTTSTSEEFDEHKTSIVFTNTASFTDNDFVACIYENQW